MPPLARRISLLLLACAAYASALESPRKSSRPAVAALRLRGGSTMSPPDAYRNIVAAGERNAKQPPIRIFHANVMSGLFIGIVASLSLTVAGGIDGIAAANPILRTFAFAALFPFTLLLIMANGGQLFTGNCAATPSALYEGKLTLAEVAWCLLISYFGNMCGCVAMSFAANYIGLLVGGTKTLAAAIATKKVSASFGRTLVKGIGANWLVCIAISTFAGCSDLVSKVIAGWWPVMTFVVLGLEHSVANMFMFPAGLMSGAEVSFFDIIFKNMVPATIGNMIAGFVFVAASNSFAFGALGVQSGVDGAKAEAGAAADQAEVERLDA